jgi:ankyrin repeat protein
MLSLPIEIRYLLSKYLNHREYTRLRLTCKFLSRLDTIHYLYFKSYVESVANNHNPKLLSQIRLDNQCLNDASFLFIAAHDHSGEFIRLFQRKACMNISTIAKDQAFVGIIDNGHSPKMICELLKDGFVNATLSVYCKPNQTTALHWACMNFYMDAALLLLNYDNVDVCSNDNFGNEPIHYAAELGHTESYSF